MWQGELVFVRGTHKGKREEEVAAPPNASAIPGRTIPAPSTLAPGVPFQHEPIGGKPSLFLPLPGLTPPRPHPLFSRSPSPRSCQKRGRATAVDVTQTVGLHLDPVAIIRTEPGKMLGAMASRTGATTGTLAETVSSASRGGLEEEGKEGVVVVEVIVVIQAAAAAAATAGDGPRAPALPLGRAILLNPRFRAALALPTERPTQSASRSAKSRSILARTRLATSATFAPCPSAADGAIRATSPRGRPTSG